jgi:ectoine hydroxylase-related dioxygenase (phytanoyl-CoA dioxygenase family)
LRSDSFQSIEEFHRDGFAVIRQLFDPLELRELAEHVRQFPQPPAAELARYGAEPLDLFGRQSLSELTAHELRLSARLLRLHLFDAHTRALMLDPRLFSLVRGLWPGEPLAVHALYFPKPPGARGIALHSDTGYLPVDPPELAGCFIAVDDADAENGALNIVRGSHRMAAVGRRPIPTDDFLFPEEHLQPPGTELVMVEMKAGDVLLFDGGTLHASMPNRTADRWRRAFICHYISARVQSVSEYFNPAFRASGEEIPGPGWQVGAAAAVR